MTECSGASCLLRELINPEPQTIVFYVVLGALVLYAARRGGREGGEFYDVPDMESVKVEAMFEDEDDDLPPPVVHDEDDDLELLEELDDL